MRYTISVLLVVLNFSIHSLATSAVAVKTVAVKTVAVKTVAAVPAKRPAVRPLYIDLRTDGVTAKVALEARAYDYEISARFEHGASVWKPVHREDGVKFIKKIQALQAEAQALASSHPGLAALAADRSQCAGDWISLRPGQPYEIFRCLSSVGSSKASAKKTLAMIVAEDLKSFIRREEAPLSLRSAQITGPQTGVIQDLEAEIDEAQTDVDTLSLLPTRVNGKIPLVVLPMNGNPTSYRSNSNAESDETTSTTSSKKKPNSAKNRSFRDRTSPAAGARPR